MDKEVLGFPGYIVKDTGVVLNTRTGKTCSPEITRLGYIRVKIKGPDGWKKKLIHRLVMETFYPDRGREVNHIDGNKANNCISNLEWVSRSENLRHAFQAGLKVCKRGPRNLLDSEVQLIKELKSVLIGADIAELFGVSKSTINRILTEVS